MIIEALQTIVLALVLYFLIDSFMARVRVDKISMRPTLDPGQLLLVNKTAYRFGEVQRGDIVVFHYPLNPAEDYIKRVIGVPGDTVLVENGQVFVNGQELVEDYIADAPTYTGEWEVPEEMYFVLGDNRNQSSDSHRWGFVPEDHMLGKAIFVYWPLDKIKTLNQPLVVKAAN
ncbi:MAG: signal peptidase I [Chloroflexi bacterium]|nr:signal peptidase I [Chloroflexota bacterium]